MIKDNNSLIDNNVIIIGRNIQEWMDGVESGKIKIEKINLKEYKGIKDE